MIIISSVTLLLALIAMYFVLRSTRKAHHAQVEMCAEVLRVIAEANGNIVEGLKSFTAAQIETMKVQVVRANHDTACLHYTLAALRPYLFNLMEVAVKNDKFEDASVCREMINNIDRLLQTDFTKIK